MLDVSVLLVTFNHEQYVRRALDSISSQITSRTMEIVVADDNSTDATVAIIRDWATGAGIPVRILEREPQLGITRNYRRGFNACRGQYVVVLEGDDEWISVDKVDLQCAELDARPHLSMVANRVLFFDETRSSGVVIPPVAFESMRSEFSSSEIAKNNWFATFSCCMYRSDLLKRIPPAVFDTTSYDWAINMAVTEFGPAGFLPQVMTFYRQHSGGQWSKLDRIQQDEQLAQVIPAYVKIFGPRLQHELMRVLVEVEGRLARSREAEAESDVGHGVDVVEPDLPPAHPIPRVVGDSGLRVSVVMACHDDGEVVLDAVTSVLAQTVDNIELIIVDDGSEKYSIATLAEIKDPRLRVYRLESRQGIAAALNLAIQQARAEFVAVIEPTALWKPNKLERQLQKMAENSLLGAIFTGFSVLDNEGNPLPEGSVPRGLVSSANQPGRSQAQWLQSFFAEGNALCHSSVLVRRSFYEERGLYDNRLSRQFDLERWVALVKHHPIEVLDGSPLVQLRTYRGPRSTRVDHPLEHAASDFADHVLINQSFFDGVSSEMIVSAFSDFLRQKPNYEPPELECEIAMLWLNFPGSRNRINQVQALRELSGMEFDPVSSRLLLTRYGFDNHALRNLARFVYAPSILEGDRVGASRASHQQITTALRGWVSRVKRCRGKRR